MKILKKIGMGILGLIALLLIIALFIPNDYTVSVSTTINKPKSVVFDYVKLLKNQENYSVWVMQDPNLKPIITSTDGTVGVKQSWNSKDDKVGEGEQIITKMTDDSILVEMHFKRPMEDKGKGASIIQKVNETQTTIKSEFYGHNNYPMNLMNMVINNMLKKDMAKNLANLKAILEKQ